MSSIHNNNLGSVSLRTALDALPTMEESPLETVSLDATPGQGGLAGRTIKLGDGEKRKETVFKAEKQQSAFVSGLKTVGKWAGKLLALPFKAVGAVLYGVTIAVPKLIHNKILEPRSEKQFKLANEPMMKALGTPREDSVLSKGGVEKRLVDHAKTNGTKVTQEEIREMVSTGEHICKALQGAGGDKLPLKVTIGGKEHTVEANGYMARCVSWYMMAQAAAQDSQRASGGDTSGRTDMTSNGSFVMKDEGNRLYNFLSSAPTCGSRMSTHFEERVDHSEKHKVGGLIPTNKPAQRGIEDYQSKMPGQGGTMLFDKLKDGELFVKFESGGCPPYFQKEKNQGIGTGFCRFFAALDRNIGHTFSFLASRDHGGGEKVGLRQEHVYKGVMKPIAKDFGNLVTLAVNEGVIDGDSKAIGKSVHKLGLPYVLDAIATIQEHAREHGNQRVLQHCTQVLDKIAAMTHDLGFASDQYGIQRRGAEVHIGL